MARDSIYFFHGLEGGPVGAKSTRLDEDFDVIAPDCEGVMDIWERLEIVEEATEGEDDMVVVGSSFGGLLAALLYAEHPERFGGYVLMAPALYRDASDSIDAAPEASVVVHGGRDEVVPAEPVRAFCQTHDVELIEVDDDHRLHDSFDTMIEATRRVLEAVRTER